MNNNELKLVLNKAKELINQHDWSGALEVLDEAIVIDSGHIDAWYQKGKILNRLGMIEEALEAFDRVIDINSEYADGWYNRGVCLTKLGRNEESLEAFRESSRLNPDSSASASLEGVNFLGILGRDQSALEALKDIVPAKDESVYVNDAFMFEILREFVWEDGTSEILGVYELSSSDVEVRSSRYHDCVLNVQAKERIPCNYPAKELARDLAVEITSNENESRFYVFPNGLVPACAVRTKYDAGDEIWLDIIVTDRFVYNLKRTVILSDSNSVRFAESVLAIFRPISGD